MRTYLFLLFAFLTCQLGYSQSMECGGITVTVVSANDSEIQVKVDVTDYGKQVNAPGDRVAGFALTNGTCQGCKPVGGPNNPAVRTWTIKNEPGATTLAFTHFLGNCKNMAPLTIDKKEMECTGIKLTLLSADNSGFQVQVDVSGYGKQINAPGDRVAAFDLTNGTCQGCKPVGGPNNPAVRTWNIKNGTGSTKLIFSRFIGACKGKAFILD